MFYTRSLFGLLVFTPKQITLYLGLRWSMFYTRSLFGLLVFTPKRITVYMGHRQSMVYSRSSFGLLVFTPKWITLYMGLQLSEFDARFSFRLLVFTPKRIIYGTSVIQVWSNILLRVIGLHPETNTVTYDKGYARVLRNFIWPSVLIGPQREWASKWIRVHWSVCPSSSSEEGSHRRIASECHLEKWAQGSQSLTACSTLWSQFLIFPSRKDLPHRALKAFKVLSCGILKAWKVLPREMPKEGKVLSYESRRLGLTYAS